MGVTFDPGTRMVTGTPATAGRGTVTVTDQDGDRATLAFTVTVRATTPGVPAAPGLTAAYGAVAATWAAPAQDGGSPLTGYELQWTAAPAGLWSAAAVQAVSGTAYTITGLANGTAYAVRVRAVNAVGAGAWSAGTEATPGTAEAARYRRVSQSLLPRVGQALAAGPLRGVTARVARLGQETPAGLTYRLGGQSRLSAAAVDLGRALGQGSVNLAQVLGGSGFALALTPAAGLGLRDVVLWGQGHYQNLGSRGASGAVTWDGDVVSAQVGVDAQVHPQVLAGVLVNWGQGTFDWQERLGGLRGDYEVTMTSVHPYVGWRAADGAVEGWGSVGYGWGDVGFREAPAAWTATSDGVLRTAAVGATGRLLGDATVIPGGRTDVRAKGEWAVASVAVEGTAWLAGVTEETRRLRALVEVVHARALAGGGQVVPSLEVGLRHDAGDGPAGVGLETGVGLRYEAPAWGLTVDGHLRMLTLSSAEYEEWGGAVQVQVDPGPSQEGARVQVTTGYGVAASGVQQLWTQALPAAGPGARPATPRVAAEVGYGLAWPGGNSVVLPYSGVTWTGQGARQYRLGGRWQWTGQGTVSLEGAQQEQVGGGRDYRVLLEGQWQF